MEPFVIIIIIVVVCIFALFVILSLLCRVGSARPASGGGGFVHPNNHHFHGGMMMGGIIGGTDGSASKEQFHQFFGAFGEIVDFYVSRKARCETSAHFAFVRYRQADESQNAIHEVDGKDVGIHKLVVSKARP